MNSPMQETIRSTPVHALDPEHIEAELKLFENEHGFTRPTRSAVDPTRPWKEGVPNYNVVDLAFFRGKSKNHAPGSLESIVENAVKNWEMEGTHLAFENWRSVDPKTYNVCANGATRFKGDSSAIIGNYNWLMDGTDKSVYDSSNETFESSHVKFRTAFPGGFPWEVLSVFSGPPRLSFTWRHWALFDGEYEGREGDGKEYNMYGFGIVDVNADLKIELIEIYYKPEEFLKALRGDLPSSALAKGQDLVGTGCPFAMENPK